MLASEDTFKLPCMCNVTQYLILIHNVLLSIIKLSVLNMLQ